MRRIVDRMFDALDASVSVGAYVLGRTVSTVRHGAHRLVDSLEKGAERVEEELHKADSEGDDDRSA